MGGSTEVWAGGAVGFSLRINSTNSASYSIRKEHSGPAVLCLEPKRCEVQCRPGKGPLEPRRCLASHGSAEARGKAASTSRRPRARSCAQERRASLSPVRGTFRCKVGANASLAPKASFIGASSQAMRAPSSNGKLGTAAYMLQARTLQ